MRSDNLSKKTAARPTLKGSFKCSFKKTGLSNSDRRPGRTLFNPAASNIALKVGEKGVLGDLANIENRNAIIHSPAIINGQTIITEKRVLELQYRAIDIMSILKSTKHIKKIKKRIFRAQRNLKILQSIFIKFE